MSNPYWLSEAQMDRLRPYFPKSRGRARIDDRRVLSGIIFINRNGVHDVSRHERAEPRLRWCDAPAEYGRPKTLYNRWKRWSDMGVFVRIMMGQSEQAPDNMTISIDATDLKAHRTASSLRLKKGAWASDRADQRWYEHESTCSYRPERTSRQLLYQGGSSQRLYWCGCLDERPTGDGLVACRQGI
jgi:transposase